MTNKSSACHATCRGRSPWVQPGSVVKASPLPCVKPPEQMQSDRKGVTGLGHHRGGGGDNQTLFLPVQWLPKTPERLTEVWSLSRRKHSAGRAERPASLPEAGDDGAGEAQRPCPGVRLRSSALPWRALPCAAERWRVGSACRGVRRARCPVSPERWQSFALRMLLQRVLQSWAC